MYRDTVRSSLAALLLVACSKAAAPSAPPGAAHAAVPPGDAAPVAIADAAAAPVPPPPDTYATLAEALAATIPDDARVVGFGELHNRIDRAAVPSSLSRFTAALPSLGDKISDLIVETWLVDPKCGQTAVKATQQMETTVKRPEATKSEIALLADAAKAAKIQPHAMTLSCADYGKLVHDGQVDPLAMLTLTTRELSRISTSAVLHRDKEPGHRPWIAVYGGALHNDRFPDQAVAEWSYAAKADQVTGGHFVEIDLIVPELAAADQTSRKQPWFSEVEHASDRIKVWRRNERSFVVILAKTP